MEFGNGDYAMNCEESDSIIDRPACLISSSDIVREIYGNNVLSLDAISNMAKVAVHVPKNDHCNEIIEKV